MVDWTMGHPTDPTDDPMIPNHQMFFFQWNHPAFACQMMTLDGVYIHMGYNRL